MKALDKATARPWKWDGDRKLLGGGDTAVVADIHDYDMSEGEANARLIVRAVNHFEEMRYLLQTITDHASEAYPHFESERGQREIQDSRRLLACIEEEG